MPATTRQGFFLKSAIFVPAIRCHGVAPAKIRRLAGPARQLQNAANDHKPRPAGRLRALTLDSGPELAVAWRGAGLTPKLE
jgi:hypothetical protein